MFVGEVLGLPEHFDLLVTVLQLVERGQIADL